MLAVFVAACMLLCTLSPAIINWNEEGSFATGDTPDKEDFVYVSLGDSTTNGYGISGYYPSDKIMNDLDLDDAGIRGFLQEAPAAYPSLVKGYLAESLGDEYAVKLIQLAVSGFRADELRMMLDPDFEKDTTANEVFFAPEDHPENKHYYYEDLEKFLNFCKTENLYPEYLEEDTTVEEFYQAAIADADLITYALGTNNFGTFVTSALAALLFDGGEGLRMPDLNKYIDPAYVEVYNEFRTVLFERLSGILISEMGMDPAMLTQLGSFLAVVVDVFTYGYVSFIANFDATMGLIYESNPDVNILVVPIYNMISGVTFLYGDIVIPIGDFYGYLIDSVNFYASYLSPYAVKNTSVEIGEPLLFIDEMKAGDLSDDAKAGVAEEFGFEDLARGMVEGTLIEEGVLVEDGDDITISQPMLYGYVATVLLPAKLGCEAEDIVESTDPFKVKDAYADAVTEATTDLYVSGVDGIVDTVYAGFLASNNIADDKDLYDFVDLAVSKGRLTQLLADIANADAIDFAGILGGLNFESLVSDLSTYIVSGENKPADDVLGIYHIYIRTMLADGLFIHPSADGYRETADAIIDAYEFSISGESKGEWFDLYELYLYGGMPMVKAYIDDMLVEYKDQLDAVIAELEGRVAELMDAVSQEAMEVLYLVNILQKAIDELKENAAYAFYLISNGAAASEALEALGLNELYMKGVGILTQLAEYDFDSAKLALGLLESSYVKSLLEKYNYFVDNKVDDLTAYIDAVILDVKCKVHAFIADVEAKIAELEAYVSSPDVLITIYVLQTAVDELKGNLEAAEQLANDGASLSEILVAIDLSNVYYETVSTLEALAGEGSEPALVALLLLESDKVSCVIEKYDELVLNVTIIEYVIEMIVMELSTYVDDDAVYYAYDDILYISDRSSLAFSGTSIEDIIGALGSMSGNLRLMDMVALLTKTEFDGKVQYSEFITEYMGEVADMLPTSNVVIIDANAGNLSFILNEFVNYENAEDLDFGIYSDIIGDDAAAFMNDIENMLAPYIEKIGEKFPDYVMPAELLTFLAQRLAYMSLATFEGLLCAPMAVQYHNELATVMFAGMYNPFEGVSVIYDGKTIPVGEIFDAYVAVFNTVVYELCEEMPQVVYVDITGMHPSEKPIIIDLSEENGLLSLMPVVARFMVNSEYVVDQATDYLAGMEERPIYNTVWVDGNGEVLWEVPNQTDGYLDVDYYEFDVDPVKDMDADYRYEFADAWSEEIVNGDTMVYTALFNEVSRKPVVESNDVEVTVDIQEILQDESVTNVVVKNDVVTVSFPKEIFAGCETATVTMKVVEQSALPGAIQAFTEGKKVISLELFLDGQKTSDFGESSVSVSVDYQLAEGEDASTLTVWYMNEKTMELEEVASSFENGVITITMDHFSYWVIGHEVVEDCEDDDSITASIAVLLVIITGLAVALLRFKR